MKASHKTGLGFGLTSGVITTLGLIVGLNAGTHSLIAVAGGILTIAIADALSDALGIHISEESKNRLSQKSIWEATLTTFLTKFVCSLTFIIPFLIFDLNLAITLSIIWGFFILSIFSYAIARKQAKHPMKVILEHISIAAAVIIASYFAGEFISTILLRFN